MFSRYLEELKKPFYHFCYVGKFNPFHKAHKYMYDFLVNTMHKYNLDGNVYICTSMKDSDFLTASQKARIIQLSGVPADHIVNHSGYSIKGLLSAVNGKEEDTLVTAFSQKDLDDGSKTDFLKIPKDQITSWRIIKNLNDLPYIRPVNFIHKEYKDMAEKKAAKGTGYAITVPTQTSEKSIVSSSLIRKLIEQNKWDEVKKLMDNNAFKYLKEIKEIKTNE